MSFRKLRFVLPVLLALITSVEAWGQSESAASQEAGAQSAGPALSGGNNAQTPENRKRALEFLVNELAQLTPGGLEANPALEAVYSEAASNLMDEKVEDSVAVLKTAAEGNANVPPVDLLIAAMFYAGNNPVQGAVSLEKASKENPDYPLIYTSFARLAIAQGRLTDGRVLLEKAESLIARESDPVQKDHFTNSLLDSRVDLLVVSDLPAEARIPLAKLMETQPDLPKNIMRLAEIDFREGKYDDCLAQLRRYSQVQPGARAPELVLATLFQQDGKPEEAGKWVKKAYELNDSDIPVLTEYAAWNMNREQFTAANEALRKVQDLAGNLPVAELMKAKMAFAEQSYDLAESRFGELAKMDPENAEVANLWAMSLAESTSSDKLSLALEKAQQNVQKQPQNAFTATVLAWVYFRQKNYDQANAWFGRAAQSRNMPPEAGYYFARFLQHIGENEKALDLISNALESKNLFLYRRAAEKLKGELTAGNNNLTPPGSGNKTK